VTALDRAPSRTRARFVCPHCDAFCGHFWGALGTEAIDDRDGPFVAPLGGTYYDNAAGDRRMVLEEWAVSRCQGCNAPSLWRGDTVVYPSSSTLPAPHEDMPDTVKSLYEEARRVAAVSPRAGAALARATLETLLPLVDDDPSSKRSFGWRIERVSRRVPTQLGRMLDVIRHAGNKSVHPEDAPDGVVALVLDPASTGTMEMLFEAINELVDELITKPVRYAEIIERIPSDVQAAIERRSKAAVADTP
jgi:hypothetical protein